MLRLIFMVGITEMKKSKDNCLIQTKKQVNPMLEKPYLIGQAFSYVIGRSQLPDFK